MFSSVVVVDAGYLAQLKPLDAKRTKIPKASSYGVTPDKELRHATPPKQES